MSNTQGCESERYVRDTGDPSDTGLKYGSGSITCKSNVPTSKKKNSSLNRRNVYLRKAATLISRFIDVKFELIIYKNQVHYFIPF